MQGDFSEGLCVRLGSKKEGGDGEEREVGCNNLLHHQILI